jgi:SAM-dependent methyltransferase/uncharacterized protein YbaR (Trm112 family)
MRRKAIDLLRCPACGVAVLTGASFAEVPHQDHEIVDGVVWCRSCSSWFPVEDRLLDLLSGDLAYREDRRRFWETYRTQLTGFGLAADLPSSTGDKNLAQTKQQSHFDWYAENQQQTYAQYEQMPFWRVVDEETYGAWIPEIGDGKWLLEVGCAQGRSTSYIADCPISIVAFDISKSLVRQAIARFRRNPGKADISFFVADASRFPVIDSSFDYVLIYGVLHHVPDAGFACREVARTLKPGGIYFGLENNETIFRKIFDFWQRLKPLWHEEAGLQALMGRNRFKAWFQGTNMDLDMHCSVFIPPELVNFLGRGAGRWLLRATDGITRLMGSLKNQGGLIVIRGKKRGLPAP